MFAGRRFALLATCGVVVWYACVLSFWALRPLTDSIPVGVDYTLTPAKFVSVSVKCQSVVDSASRGDSPLPQLTVQPKGSPPLAFQREPCDLAHGQARLVLLLDTAAVAGVVIGFGWLTLRRRRSASVVQFSSDAGLTLSH